MAISLDTTSGASVNVLLQGTSNVNLTVGNNQDRLLVVSLGTFNGPIVSVSYAGVPLTRIDFASAGSCRAEMWFLLAPTIGTNVLNINTSPSSFFYMNFARPYFGVDQGPQPHISTKATGSTNTITASVTTTIANTLLIDSITTVANPTKGAAQTLRGQLAGSNQFSYQHAGASDMQLASAGVGTMTWALSSAAEWETVVAAFAPAPTHTPTSFTAKAAIVNNTKKATMKARIRVLGAQKPIGIRAWINNKTVKGPLADMEMRSVDIMKLSKDGTTNQLSDTAIDNVTRFLQENMNLTHIGLACNIDPVEWFPSGYTPSPRTLVALHQKWADSIHARGLRILHRLEMFSIQNKSGDANGFLWRAGSNRYPAGRKEEIIPTTWTDSFNRTTIESSPGTITYGSPFTDDFTRADTTQVSNNIGSSWTGFGTAGGGWNIDTNRLKLFQPGNEFTYNIARTTAQYGNAEYVATVQAKNSGKNGVIVYGFQVGGGTFFQGYVIYISSANTVEIADVNVASSSRVAIASDSSLTFTPGQSYKIKVQTVSNTIRVKVWNVASIEPATWLMTVSNTKYGFGFFGLAAEGFDSGSLFYDDVSITPITVPGYVSDWNPTGSWSMVNNQLECTNATSAFGNYIYTKTTYKDFTLTSKVKSLPGSGKTGVVFRFNSSGAFPGFSGYAVRINNNASLDLEDSGSSTLSSTAKTVTPDTLYNIKVDCQGSAIKARIWLVGDSEPATWDINTTSTKYATGGVGYFPSNATQAFYDDISVVPYPNLASLLGIVYNYLVNNPTIFQNGDILAPWPEKTAGTAGASGVGDGGSWLPAPYDTNYVQVFNDLKDIADYVFASQGKQIITGHSSNNFSEVASGWVAPSLYNKAGIVATDYYGNTDQLQGGPYETGTIAWDGNVTVTGTGTTFTTQLKPKYFIYDRVNGLRAEVLTVNSNTQVTVRTAFFYDPSDTFLIPPTFSSTPFTGHTWQIHTGFGQDGMYESLNKAYNGKGGNKKIEVQEWGPVPTMINSTFTATVSPSIPERGFALNTTTSGVYREAELMRPYYLALAQLLNENKLFGFNYWGFWDTGPNDTGLLSGSVNTFSSMQFRRDGHVLAEMYNAGTSPQRSFTARARIKAGPGRLSGLTFRSVDFMKLTKDTTTGQPSDTVIENYVSAAYTLLKNLTHIGIVLPIDPLSFYPGSYTPSPRTIVQVYQKWSDEIHKKGLGMLHRCVNFAEEGLSGFTLRVGANRYPPGVVSDVLSGADRNSWLGIFYNFIVNNPNIFANGDIWAPWPESTESNFTTRNVSSLTRSGNVATLVTTTNHDADNGKAVKVIGANQSEYNGSHVMTVVNSTTLTYTVSGSPATPATGTMSIQHGRSPYDADLSVLCQPGENPQTAYLNFFVNLKTVCDAAFAVIGKQVFTGYTSENFSEVKSLWIPQGLFNNNHLISFDYYQNNLGNFDFRGAQAKADADGVYNSRGHFPIFWQEWGTTPDMISNVTSHDSVNHFGDVSGAHNANRAAWITDFYTNGLAALLDQGKLIGFNYWGFWDTGDDDSGLVKLLGSAATLSNITLRDEGVILANFYDDKLPKVRFTARARITQNHSRSFSAGARIKNQAINDLTSWTIKDKRKEGKSTFHSRGRSRQKEG